MAEEIIEFDVERRKTRFEDYRQCCKKYHSVAGASPGFLKAPERLYGSQAFKTDIEFGSGDEKSSLIVIPLNLGDSLDAAKLTGISLGKVFL